MTDDQQRVDAAMDPDAIIESPEESLPAAIEHGSPEPFSAQPPLPAGAELAREQAGSLQLVDRPVEGRVIEVPLTIEKHYWAVWTGRGDRRKIDHYEMSRPGLIILCGKADIGVRSWNVQTLRNYARAMAEGECLWPSGYLEKFTRVQEYDADREFEKSVLKTARDNHEADLKKAPFDIDPRTLLTGAEMASLREAQLGILTHLDAHCRSRAEDQVMRYFLYKMGAPLQLTPEEAKEPIIARLIRTRETFEGQAADAIDALFGERADKDSSVPPGPRSKRGRGTSTGQASSTDSATSSDTSSTRSKPTADTARVPPTEEASSPPPAPPSDPTPIEEETICDWVGCDNAMTVKEIAWCRDHKAKFDGHMLCFKHQKEYQPSGEADDA